MKTTTLHAGTVHDKIPADLEKAILSSKAVLSLWEDITPLARNEWICWIENAKKDETRKRRVEVGISKMKSGMRRPCCWVGCIHRTDKPLSSSAQWVINRTKSF
jgi:hypothetical protein